MVDKPLPARVWGWLVDRALEGIWQAVVMALLGGGSVIAIFRGVGSANWYLVGGLAGVAFVLVFLAVRLVDALRSKPVASGKDAKPGLLILDKVEYDEVEHRFRIRVENRTDTTVEIRATIASSEPSEARLRVPFLLQVTGAGGKSSAHVAPKQSALFDVLRPLRDQGVIQLIGADGLQDILKQKYRLRITAYAGELLDERDLIFDPAPRDAHVEFER